MSPMRGIGLKIGSVLIFIVMASLVKHAADTVPPGQAVFFRSFFAIPVILIWLAREHDLRAGLSTSNPMGHVWRGLLGTSAMGLGFAALALLPLPEVTALGYASPLLVVIFAAMFLGEEVRAFRLTTVAIGLAGVMVILWPRLTVGAGALSAEAQLGAILVLMGAVFSALAQVFVRSLVRVERTSAIVFYFSVTASVMALVTAPFGWVWPDATTLAALIGAGLLGGFGQILLTSSYRHADASVIAPFEYASILFAVVIGYSFFGEVPSVTVLGGSAIVIFAGVLIILRERKLGLERDRQRKAMAPN